MKPHPWQNAKRIVRVHKARYHATPDKVFPLLCPVVEYDWLENWRADIIYSKSGVAELDNIFKTSPSPGKTDIWTVTRYEKNTLIEFIVMNADCVIRFTITLYDNRDGTTDSEWKQLATALSPEGEAALDALTEEAYAQHQGDISMRFDYFLEHKKMYKKTVQ